MPTSSVFSVPPHRACRAPVPAGFVATLLLLLLAAGGCGEGEESKDAGSDTLIPVFTNDAGNDGSGTDAADATPVDTAEETVEDVTADATDDATTDGVDGTDAQITDVAEEVVQTSAVKLTIPEILQIGGDGEALIEVKQGDGSTKVLPDGAELSLEIDGTARALGFDPTVDLKAPPAVVLWQTSKGALRVVGVRPGSASVVVKVGGVASVARTVNVGFGELQGVVARVPDAGGATSAEQQADVTGGVKIGGKAIGGGGLEATIRFPANATAGASFEVGPGKPGIAKAAFADLAGTSYDGAQGNVFVDQTTKGEFRGTAWVRSAKLKPMVIAFRVPRDGSFGIDPLDDGPVEIAKSAAPEPTTGVHHSRVSVLPGAPGKGRIHIVWREIENVLKARLRRVDVALVDGTVDTSQKPLLDDLNAYDGTPDIPAAALGEVALIWNGGQGLLVWEGRDGKGSTKPHALHAVLVDEDLVFLAAPIALAPDGCAGTCRPRLAALEGGRFIVVWSHPSAGVQATRVKGLLADGKMETAEETPIVVHAGGKDGDVAVHQNAVLISYFDPDSGPVWRPYTDKATGSLGAKAPAQAFGLGSPQAPPVALAPLTLLAQPNFLFTATWIDLLPKPQQRVRRIGVDGTALGAALDIAEPAVESLRTYPGKVGQIISAGAEADGGIVVWKRAYASFGDDGSQLGELFVPLAASNPPMRAALAYEKTADAWVVAWSGWQKSTGVAFRRFR